MCGLTCNPEEGDGVEGPLVAGASAGAYGSGTCTYQKDMGHTGTSFSTLLKQLKALTWRKDLFGIIECRTEVSVGAGLDLEARRLL